MKKLKQFLYGAVTVLVATVVAFLGAEIALRLAYLDAPWTARNFTADPVNQQVTNLAIRYDPVLGYIARPDYRGGINTHGRMGVRLHRSLKTGEKSPPIPTGGILASGDSFTFGSEVSDHQSWPARLEAELGTSVVNAGAGGYGIDQAVLRAVQLLDVVKPRAIIISFIPNNVGRDEFSINQGLVKPYFNIEAGKLVLKGVPVPDYQPSRRHVGFLRATLGHSYAIYWLMDRLGLRKQWLVYEAEVRKAHNNGVAVSCALWQWLKDKVAGRGIRLIALAQYAGIQVNGHDNSRDHYKVPYVLECARKAGYLVVDSYDQLRKRFDADERSFWELWVRQLGPQPTRNGIVWHMGHMSPEGNQLTADLLADVIRKNNPELLGR